MTPEGKVKDKVKKLLQEFGAYYFMPVQTGFGAPTIDFLACHNGRFLGIETKAPGKKPTPRQEVTMGRINAAGGKTLVIDGDTEKLLAWLEGR